MTAHSLQYRVARSISFAVLVSFVAGGLILVGLRHSMLSRSLEGTARTFGALVALPVAQSVDPVRSTDRQILERRIERWRSMNDDLVRMEVVDVDGAVVMRSEPEGIEIFTGVESRPVVGDAVLLSQVRGLELAAVKVAAAGGEKRFRVVAPAVEEWGRHAYSLVLTFSYDRVNRERLRTAGAMAAVLVVALLLALVVSVVLTRSITRNVSRLHTGVLRLREGHFDERVLLDSGDEIQDLGDAFDAMADNLAQTIERLREANRELEHLDQAKADLVANVSHELKTPLTALRGYLELVENGDLGEVSDGVGQAILVCQKNVSRLNVRIEELVQLSELERSFVSDPIVESVRVGRLLTGVVETLMPELEDKGVACRLEVETGLRAVLANAAQLEQVFLNLLDNARKFTPAGGSIRISAENYRRERRDGVVVRVVDTGVGIPHEKLLRVFDRFYQVDPSARRRHGGMGLGLSLVRRIVESHRGAVWVVSDEGKGSTFFVWLPERPVSSSGTHPAIKRSDSGERLQPVSGGGPEEDV